MKYEVDTERLIEDLGRGHSIDFSDDLLMDLSADRLRQLQARVDWYAGPSEQLWKQRLMESAQACEEAETRADALEQALRDIREHSIGRSRMVALTALATHGRKKDD